jgi:hypothetical protein
MTKEFGIPEIGVEEGVDTGFGIKDSLYFSIWCYSGGGSFHRSILCKWTTSLLDSTWVYENQV